MVYEFVKAGHIVAVVIWLGGMISVALVLPLGNRETLACFRAWDRSVTAPAMIATWALGLTMAVWANWFSSGWLMAKLVFVLLLSAMHGVLSGRLRRAVSTGEAASGPLVQIALPTILLSLCAIVLLVVTKFI